MSRDQRVHDNHALIAAQQRAVSDSLPLIVLFVIYTQSGVRAREHYQFMIEGLREVHQSLSDLSISFILESGDPLDAITRVMSSHQPSAVYFDFNPLHGPRTLAKSVALIAQCPCFVIDTHNIIPAWIVSDKQEFAAHTMRTKVHRQLAAYIQTPDPIIKHPYSLAAPPTGISFQRAQTIVDAIPASGISVIAQPGERAARKHLDDFINNHLDTYALQRNDIANDLQSGLSPYLHFGHISSLRVAIEVIAHTGVEPLLFHQALLAKSGDLPSAADGMNALLEEMIVRKELADNYCLHSSTYTNLSGALSWANITLDTHRDDQREFVYTRDQWESASTHDPAWNAAQTQLLRSGKIHGYMRMYWAKKILEWSASPDQALATCIYLNDHYSIDGGDPNGYVGILWSIAGLHDRPWTERPVFGKIRYMNYGGLMRKFDIKKYIETWS
jgi:deoxyribodipyrimidine photo-lyase